MRGFARGWAIATIALAAGCTPERPPPRNTTFEGLPVTGSVAFAKHMGFTQCLDFNAALRCRRSGIMFAGEGPYSGAVDSKGGGGRGGFEQLTLWDDRDQHALTLVGQRLLASGWSLCRTGTAERGDQNVYRKPGARVRVSIDASYWGKRRLRVMPETGSSPGKCW